MKRLIFTIIGIIAFFLLNAQTPNSFKYQAVLRDVNGSILKNETVAIGISIVQDSVSGPIVFNESYSITTSTEGMININIGSKENLNVVNWNSNIFFLEISVNDIIIGTSQLLSVPYALHANSADTLIGEIYETQNLADVIFINNSANNQIKNITDPTDAQDAATKAYVDILKAQLDSLKELLVENGIIAFQAGDSVTFIYNGKEITYGSVEYDGRIWLDRNLGASQVATELDDAASYGHHFQWGREDDGHQISTSGTTTAIATSMHQPGHGDFILINDTPYDWNIDNNWTERWINCAGYKTTADACPDGWRIPSNEEWESASKDWYNYDDAISCELKLPAAGYRSGYNGSLINQSHYCDYWCSTPTGTMGYRLTATNSGVAVSQNIRSYGFPIRCIKD